MSMNMNPNSNNNSNIAMYRFMAAYMNKLQRNMANGGGGGGGGNSGNMNNVPSSQSTGGFYNEQNGEIDFVNPTGSGGSWRGMNGGSGGPQHDNIIPNMANGFMGGNNSFMSSNSSAANFKCPECGLTKGTCHELEVHIKTEHLNWLPFQCPMCTAVRATDTQMHEHVHSHHKKNDNKYIYLDNPPAKRMLQTMLDRALMGAAVSIARKLPSQQNSAPINSAPAQNPSYMNGFMSNGVDRGFKRPRLNMNFNEDGDVSGNFADNERSATHSPGDSDNAVEKIGHRASATVTVVPKKGPSAADAMLAQLQAQAASGHVEDGSIDNDEPTTRHPRSITEGTGNPDDEMFDNTLDNVDDETSAQLAHIFGKALPKSEFDEMDGDSTKDMDSTGGDLLGNLTNMFSGHKQEYEQLTKRKRAPRGSKGGVGSLSKKRVLGECSKCHKPVTAGARQMHMFFHLGKDFNTYRFRCKFPDCTIEHYRKDQMENHHSKQHGRIDADMMEDRSFELHNMVQELSMELLGTTGNTPGPTAAKAQLVYDAMQKEAAALANAKKRRRVNYHDFLGIRSQYHSSNYSPPTMVKTSSPLTQLSNPTPTNGGSKLPLVKSNSGSFVEDDISQDYDYADLVDSKVDLKRLERSEAIKRMRANEEEIACQLCGKKLMNRVSETQDKEMLEEIVDKIRGFHILWHLSNDLGIIRYSCKFCDFKHERPQSVSTHGKKEHGDEECVEDSLYKYEDEVKSMSKACFGIEQLFAKEVRRRNRVEREAAIAMAEEEYNNSISLFDEEAEAAEAAEADENEDSQDAADIMEKFAIKYSLPKPNSSSSNAVVNKSSNSGSGSAKKKVSKRRFGHRRPMNRKKKEDMVKLRAISFKIGGAQYFKKKINEAGHCEKCGKSTPSRMTHHAYSHLDDCQLFCCPHCNLGNWSRDLVLRHIKDFHNSAKAPIDNRLKYAQEIKDSIKECYPSYFVDAPIPTPVDIENLKKSLNLEDITLAGVNDEEENDEHVGEAVNEDEESNSVADESEQVEDEQGEEEKEEEMQEDNIDEEEEEDGAICEDD